MNSSFSSTSYNRSRLPVSLTCFIVSHHVAMVKVDIVLDHSRIFLFPASVALGSETNVIPPDDTTVRGEVVITTEEYVRIGPVRVVWEVARELKGTNLSGKRDVLARFESEVTMDDSYLEQGETR